MKLAQWVHKRSEQNETANRAFERTYDVIVVGLGTSGAVSAIAAAKLGLDVLGLEQQSSMGGTGTNGHVLSYYFGSKGGLFEQLDERASQIEAEGYIRAGSANSDAKKLALEQAAVEAGVSIRYEAVVTGVYTERRKTAGIRWVEADGIHEAGCRMLIDCTGDAAVVAMAGCPTRFGRESDGTTHAYSSVVSLLVGGRLKSYYTDSGYVDHTDVRELTRELLQSAVLPTHLKETYGDNPRLVKIAPQLGVREGRFIVGEETVAFERYLRDDFPAKPLFYAYANLDNHAKDMALESELQQEWSVVCGLWSQNFAVPIPLGALVPQGLDNALVAGRSLSVDHDLAACVRMKRDMQKCGEIAAAAAFLALRHDTAVKDVPHERLQAMLLTTGCASAEPPQAAAVEWLTDTDAIREGLASDKPGIALWSARRLGPTLAEPLTGWLEQRQDDRLRKHSALALALIGDEAALPTLREMVAARDDFMPKTSHMYNQLRGCAAIYLLGKLGDAAIVPELTRIVGEPAAKQPEERWKSEKFIVHADDYRFQYVSYALMALLRIGDRRPACRGEIGRFLRESVLAGDRFRAQFSLNSGPEVRLPYAMTERLQNITADRLSAW